MLKSLVLLIGLMLSVELFGFDHSHGYWSKVLTGYVNAQGMVRYSSLKADMETQKEHPMPAYLNEIQRVSRVEFDKWSPNDQKAFLINSYNALTLKLIVDHYPVQSIKDIGNLFRKPWSLEFFDIFGGSIRHLDAIEHDLLRSNYRDYRIHAAVNCASISCPALRSEPYLGVRLDEQLDEQMRLWLKDAARNQINAKSDLIRISRIFDWYKTDFEKWGGGLRKVLVKYVPEDSKSTLESAKKIEYLEYNWKLNAAQ